MSVFHRTLQGAYNDSWEEELACDFFAGVHAGTKGIDLNEFEAALGSTSGGDTHPNGALRANFIEFGQHIAKEMSGRGIEPTYDNCLKRLNEYIEEKGELIAEYRDKFSSIPSNVHSDKNNSMANAKFATKADLEWYEHQARITSGTEQVHWIKEAKWARDHLKS